MDEATKMANRRIAERKAKARAKRRLAPQIKDPHWKAGTTLEKVVGKNAHTPKSCSCVMCGNPRRHLTGLDRETKAELIARMHEAEGLRESLQGEDGARAWNRR